MNKVDKADVSREDEIARLHEWYAKKDIVYHALTGEEDECGFTIMSVIDHVFLQEVIDDYESKEEAKEEIIRAFEKLKNDALELVDSLDDKLKTMSHTVSLWYNNFEDGEEEDGEDDDMANN